MKQPSFAAIILAAGLSTRLESFKPLVKIGDKTLIDRAIKLFSHDSIDVCVVAGYGKDKLKNHLLNRSLTLIDNQNYEMGMFSSIKAGIKDLGATYKAFFVLPVDSPLIRPYTIKRLIDRFECYPENIIYPVFAGRRGHPPLIPSCLIPEILNSSDKGGLRAVLERFEKISLEVAMPDKYILVDIDTVENYNAVCQEFSSYDIPTAEECETIFMICGVDTSRRLHGYKVAEIAVRLGRALIEAGKNVNLELIQSAALLHDIAKQQPQHDLTGGRILKEMGFDRVGEIVAVHTFLDEQIPVHSLEAVVVYLADKFVRGDKLVTLVERYSISNRSFDVNAEVQNIIFQRKQRAIKAVKELENLIGKPLEYVIGL